MLDSLVRVSRRGGWVTDLLHAARGPTQIPLRLYIGQLGMSSSPNNHRRAARSPADSPVLPRHSHPGTFKKDTRAHGSRQAGLPHIRAIDVPSNESQRPTTRRNTPADASVERSAPQVGFRGRSVPRPSQRRRAETPGFDLRGPTRLALSGFTCS